MAVEERMTEEWMTDAERLTDAGTDGEAEGPQGPERACEVQD